MLSLRLVLHDPERDLREVRQLRRTWRVLVKALKTFKFSRAFNTRVEPTPNVLDCAAMFGLGVDEDIEITLYQDLPITIGAGNIVFITGESGAGKSCLLRDIASRVRATNGFTLITHKEVGDYAEKPMVDQFGDWPLKKIGEVLAYVGIAEAFIFLRKPKELSDGQRYRFSLAQMIYQASTCDDVPVICIDEYLAFLDRETARNVAYQTRRVATKYKLCFALATTHSDILLDLQPNTTVTMRLNMKPEWIKTPLAGV